MRGFHWRNHPANSSTAIFGIALARPHDSPIHFVALRVDQVDHIAFVVEPKTPGVPWGFPVDMEKVGVCCIPVGFSAAAVHAHPLSAS